MIEVKVRRGQSIEKAISIFKKLRESGIPEYSKKDIQIWSETRPTIQNEISE